jgi:HAD superfamily phosphatase (TIGR01668 family)
MTLVPDFYCDDIYGITPEYIKSKGIIAVILDIDNTLEPYENPMPGERVLNWLRSLDDRGIKYAIVSNNNKERVEEFNKNLKMPAYFKAGKPFKKKIICAMNDIGTSSDNTVFMGDQVFTDVWGAHNSKIPAILVPPIKDKTDPFTKFKRLLEKPFLKQYDRKHSQKGAIAK